MSIPASTQAPFDLGSLGLIKVGVTVGLLTTFWCWETIRPFFRDRKGRVTHAVRNLAVSAFNAVAMGITFGLATVWVAEWAGRERFGLLHLFDSSWPLRLLAALVLLDGWMYFWHRFNHAVPLLWRFHRMHHSDDEMDVTTATRFHLGELVGSGVARLALVPLLGLEVWQLLIYETLVVAVTQLHHANVSLGRWDRPLSWFVVTPYMHKVHHSRWRPETDSNYSTLLSVWDRLFGSFRTRENPASVELGLEEFDDLRWQTIGGMFQTPFVDPGRGVPHANGSGTRVDRVEGSSEKMITPGAG